MASRKQIAANRRNAKLSTGPKTEEGKAAVRHNALKHGLTSELLVIDGEDHDEFEEVRSAFEDHLQPVGPVECALVQQIVVAQWRLTRIRGMETGLFVMRLFDHQREMEAGYDGLRFRDRLGFVFAKDADIFNTYGRYENRYERSFYRALHELQRLQAARSQPQDPSPQPLAPQSSAAKQTQFDPQTPPNTLEPNDLSPSANLPVPIPRVAKSSDHQIARSPGTVLPSDVWRELPSRDNPACSLRAESTQ